MKHFHDTLPSLLVDKLQSKLGLNVLIISSEKPPFSSEILLENESNTSKK